MPGSEVNSAVENGCNVARVAHAEFLGTRQPGEGDLARRSGPTAHLGWVDPTHTRLPTLNRSIVSMSLRAIARVFAVLVVLLSHVPAHAADDAAGFISDLGKRVIDVLTSTQSQAERESKFHKLFDEAFDVPGIARFVLGHYWRTATDAQREEFPKLFETYIVHVYAVRFGGYSGEQLKVTGSRPEGDNASLVMSQIIAASNRP